MGARIVNLCGDQSYDEGVREAVEVLDRGGLVLLPTETVYGVAARADRPDAVRKLREVKSRPGDTPFTVHIGDRGDAIRYAGGLGWIATRLARRAWPGPLTLVVDLDESAGVGLDDETRRAIYHDGTIGLRCPNDHVALALLRQVAGPVVIASANRAGRAAPSTVDHAVGELGGVADLALDGGRTRFGRASTIVRVWDAGYEVLRAGAIDERMLRGWSSVTILFVCTGNTCRSPMASGLARKMIAERLKCNVGDLESRNIFVRSAGTSAYGGAPASRTAIEVLADRGVDLGGHTSSPLTEELILEADYIFAMTESHASAVVRMVPSAADRTRRLSPEGDVMDPIGGDANVYASCADMIEKALTQRLDEVEL